MLPGLSGLDLVSRIQAMDPNLPVLVVTRVNAVSQAVDAIRRGAFDYVLKPVNPEDLGVRLHRAIRISEILRRKASVSKVSGLSIWFMMLVRPLTGFGDSRKALRNAYGFLGSRGRALVRQQPSVEVHQRAGHGRA